MRSEQEILESINNLRSQLGEDQFTPQSDDSIESIQARVNALDRQLASTPESFSEYVERRKVEDSRSLGDKTAAFTESFMTGAGALAKEGSKAISELFSGDVGASEVGGVFQVGINDFGRFAETLGGAAMDNFYSDENEMQREYQRYKDNFLYNQEVRPAMLETYDEEGRDFVSFGANFVDPTLLVPAAGLIAKGGSLGAKAVATGAKAGAFAARSPRLVQLSKAMAKTSRGAEKVAKGLDKASEVASIPAKLAASGTRKAIKGSALVGSKIAGGVGKAGELTSKVAGLPRAAVTGLASKVIDPKIAGSGILGAQVTGALTGQVPGLGLLTGAEAFGYIANKTGRGVERTLSTLSSTGGQKRFLQRLATTADSPRLRKLALMAHAGGATKLTDLAFNSLVNGASVGALNGALAYASGEGAEGVGAAVGSGTLMGGSLPFGQPGMKGGKSQAARDQSSINFLNAKLADDQIKQFQKLSPEARLAFATVEEAGIRAPKLAFLDKQTYLDFLRQDDPNLRQAPNAHYDMGDNTIYVNQDGNAGRSSKEAMDILTHELGHHFITQGIKDDPLFARKILEQYEAKPGEESFEFAFTTDSAGSPIDSIQLNADAKKISDGYDSIQSGDQSISVGMDANKLAQEIGAEQFAMMMVDNPNIFNTIEPSLRQKLLDGSRKVLTMFGAVDPYTGNPLDISISPILKRNKQVRNLYKNYIKQREKSIVDKVDLAEKGVAIKVRKGESADQAVDRMYGKVFGAKSFSLDDVSGFRINNKKIKKILTDIKNRLVESPEGSLRVERNQIVGKELNKDLKEALLFGDKLGNKNVLLNAMLEGIKNLTEFNFLYRAGKPSKYSDNELRARIVTPFQIRVTGLSPRSKSAASVKMDAYDLAYLRNNVEVLTKEGFTDKPEDLIKEARRVAQQALEDPEGRINPEGNYENELVTAVFGQPESAQFIKNPKLRQLLEDKKLKHSIRSYDVDALAGLVPTGKSGIAFDYFNIKNNYSPFDDKLFMPTEKADGNNNLIPFPKAKSDPAPLPGVKRTFPQQDILDALADKGLISYEAGKNDTVIAKVSTDGYPMPDYLTIYPDGSVEQAKPKLFMPASEAGAGKVTRKKIGEFEVLSVDLDGKKVGEMYVRGESGDKEVAQIKVDPNYRRKGVASALYDASGVTKPSDNLTLDAFLFWNKRNPNLVKDSLYHFRDDLMGKEVNTGVVSGKITDVRDSKAFVTNESIGFQDSISKSELQNLGLIPESSDKLFMPASEAGAGKGKQAEAAKLWQEKGTDSPYFKKWFGKSKVVDENGKPLVVRHGTQGELEGNFFDPNRLGSSTGAKDAKKGFYFSDSRLTAESYMGRDYKYTPQERQRLEQLTKRNEAIQSELKNIRSTYSSPSDAVLASRKLRNEYSQNLAEMRSIDENVETQKSGTLLDVYLNIEDPLTFDFKRNPYDEDTQSRIISEALNNGNDGVIFENMMDDPEGGRVSNIYVAFSPEQIKSATGNRGTFDAGERNILFMPSKGDTTPASVQSWDDANPTFGANFTKGMAKDNKEAAALLRKSYEDEFGEPIKAQDFTQDQVEWLGDMLAQEGEAALGRTGNAVNWYTSAVEKALSVAEEIFPEIGQKFEAKDRFLGALSITSQNMRVMDNAKAAVSQYQHKIRTGKFDYSIKHGAKADAITSNLKLYDKVEAKMGVDKLNDFLDADFTVKELIEWGRDFFGDKKFSIAGYSTDKVKGSAIFGPKIGQGFFQNLRGNYDPVTVDLWLRRTYGRLTGLSLDTALSPGDIGRIIYAVRNNKGKRKFAGLEMPEFLKGVSISGNLQKNGVANFKISDKAFESLFGDNTIGRNNYEAIYEFAEKLNREWERSFAKANTDVKKAKDAIKKAKKEDRGTTNLEKRLAKFEAEKKAIGKEKPQWAKAGSTVNDKLKPIDVPSNAERAVITKAFNVALKSLKEKGIDLTPADLQATLWYPEKDIWAYLKGENSDALNMSYDTAMEVIRDQR